MPSTLDPATISEKQVEQIAELQRSLTRTDSAQDPRRIHRISLPDSSYRLLLKIVQDFVDGKAVSEMTTQKAANFLGVSRQFLVGLLDEGKIAFHRVGTHRRVYLQDLISFRKERDRRRHAAIEQMARDALKDGIYDQF
jgi:excisionase family DNA binding protein